MALPNTSGTASFLVTRDDVINSIARKLKILTAGNTLNSNDTTTVALALNMVLKEANILGKMRWLYQTYITPFVANQISYTIAETGANITGFRPVSIAHAWRRDSSTYPQDTPMSPLTREEYDRLTPKTIPGVPCNWYYDPQIGLGTIKVWPAPMDATYSLGFTIQRPIQDILSSGQNFDVMQEWFSTLVWLGAEECLEEYEVDDTTIKRITMKAKEKREALANFSQEEGSVFFVPDPQYQYVGRFNS